MRLPRTLLLAALMLATAPLAAIAKGGFDRADMDTTCSPCKDFYQFVNGGWASRTEIPPSYSSYGTAQIVNDRNRETLHALLEDAAKKVASAPQGSNEWKIGAFYGACMDSGRAEAEGAKPIQPELERIGAIKSTADLVAEVARLHRQGVGVMFRAGSFPDLKNSDRIVARLLQGGLGLPDRDYYTKEDSTSVAQRAAYVAHVARSLQLIGDSEEQARAAADRVMAIETTLAKASLTNVERRDPARLYHPMTVAELETAAPTLGWKSYFQLAGFPEMQDLNVGMPDFIKTVDGMLTSVPLDDWKAYLRWHLVDEAAPTLSSAFVNEDFSFNKMLSGARELQPRWKRCMTSTDMALGEALGQEWVKRQFTPAAKARALDMVKNLETAMGQRIRALDWMSDSTKAMATAKLEAIRNKIGYPDKWRDYSALHVTRGSYCENRALAAEFEHARQLAKIGKPVDRTEWGMTPPTVNAYYSPTMNEIVFPAGILQPPYFDADADDAYNYGSMGSVIGHEISHGFDDQGSKFDAKGNMMNWWKPGDAEKFKSRTGVVVDQFNGYVGVDTLHVNGKLTLGENIGDLGGLAVAFQAYQNSLKGKPRKIIDGYTPEQRFFLGYAREWRSRFRPENARLRILTDPHSPAYWRVNGPLSNMEAFARAFGCKAGDAMVRSGEQQAKIW